MSTKKHEEHPHLTGEHRLGDQGQVILFVLFLGIWVTDSFIWNYSTLNRDVIPEYLRIGLAGLVLVLAWYLARKGMKAVFGSERSEPGVIDSGVFKWVRHPIYTGAILFYLGAALIAGVWILAQNVNFVQNPTPQRGDRLFYQAANYRAVLFLFLIIDVLLRATLSYPGMTL